MIAFAPLFAADWVPYVVPIVAFLIWLFNQLVGAQSPAAKQRKAMQRARPKPAAAPSPERQRVDDEVGEFLRRAAGQRGGKDVAPVAPAGAPVRQSRPQRKPQPTPPVEPVSADSTADGAVKRRSMFDEQPEESAAWSISETHAQGKEVDDAVAAMQTHLQQAFGHRVGFLGQSTASEETTVTRSTPAGELVALFRDPQSVREAIIISEILRRPEERW